MQAVDCAYWLDQSEIRLQSGRFSFEGHEYQKDILHCDEPRQVVRKAAQLGITEIAVLKTLHGHIHGRYPQGTLYLFPTQGDVTDFSKARFGPLIELNPQAIGRFVQSTDAANIKQIGTGMLYFRGARATKKIEGLKASSSRLKSVPTDRNVYDEYDEMDQEMLSLAEYRMRHSMVQEELMLSTPTIPDFGIDKVFQGSDQRIWMIRCEKCRRDTCLEMEFSSAPEDTLLERIDGTVIRSCRNSKCRAEIHPRNGRWVIQYPENTKDMVGWWISELNSLTVPPAKILSDFLNPPRGDIAEVYNSALGLPYIAAENRLTKNDVYGCCSADTMPMGHPGPCGMGVDVGKILHVVIGIKETENRRRILKVARVDDFNDVHDLAQRFNVQSAVLDMEPETRMVREFQAQEPYPVFLCDYQERLRVPERIDDDRGIVVVRRTEMCDRSHNFVVTPGRCVLPRGSPELDQYAKEMSSIAKVLEVNKETGSRIYTYRKLDPDHYRHATNYFLLACDSPQLKLHDPRSEIQKMRDASAKADREEYNPLTYGLKRKKKEYNPLRYGRR
jgi:hypothetical protein